MRLPKFDYNKLLYDGAGDEDDSKPSANRVIAVHGGLMERPMGTKKAKALAKVLQSVDLSSSNVSSLDADMAIEMKQKAEDRAKQTSIKQQNTLMKLSLMWKDNVYMEKANHCLQLASDSADKIEKELDRVAVPSVLDIPKIKKNDSTETSEGSVGTDSTSVNLDSVF